MRLPVDSGPRRRSQRSIVGLSLAVLLLAPIGVQSATAGAKSKLGDARDRLAKLEAAIEAEDAKLSAIQGDLNVLAGQIDAATGVYQQTEQTVMATRTDLQSARDRYETIRERLDDRAADAYMEGAGTGLEAILGSPTLIDFSDRLQFLNSVARYDAGLAGRAQDLASGLQRREHALTNVLARQTAALRTLDAARNRIDAKFAQERSIREDMSRKQTAVQAIVHHLKKKLAAKERARARALAAQGWGGRTVDIPHNPFHMCPVGRPHAFTDDFGAPRYTTSPPHPHAGNDILAPGGTPIYAPFDGEATDASGGLGGLAVIVRGADGYTYNAHVESFGTLGKVKAGTVVAYVGNTGDAAGGATHDHFEWHPDPLPRHLYTSAYGYTDVNGAIDPYPFLVQVC
jgi:murein DD-endopeptidase MepM/ murein hydrolase activator NlpD